MPAWVWGALSVLMKLVKFFFGTDAPRKETVVHAQQEVVIDDDKTDKERLDDLGL